MLKLKEHEWEAIINQLYEEKDAQLKGVFRPCDWDRLFMKKLFMTPEMLKVFNFLREEEFIMTGMTDEDWEAP